MPTMEDPRIVAVIAAVVVVAFGVVFALARRSTRSRLEKVVPAFELGTTRLVGTITSSLEGIFQGFTCRYTIENPSQHNPGGATLRVSAVSTVQWSAAVEDFGSRLMARLGLLKDIEIGDAEVDDRVRFSSRDDIAFTGLFGQERPREAIRRLAAAENFSSITVRGDRTDVKWAPRNAGLDENADAVRARMEDVIELLSASGSSPSVGAPRL
jgi:hypothetical protein